MPPGAPPPRLRVDLIAECIWRDGERFGVAPKALRVLRCLIDRPEQLVTKEELLDSVWPDTHVIDKVLNIAISQLRQALGDDPQQPRYIATVHRRGFRWIGPSAESLSTDPDEDSDAFVGRADALAELERRYALAASGRRQLVFVTGEAGIGKSTMLDRFLHGLAHDAAAGAAIGYGQCIDLFGVGEAYRPLLDAAEALLRSGGEAMAEIFLRYAPAWLLRMHDTLDRDQLLQLQRLVTDSSLDRMQRELERTLVAASSQRVVVVVLDDMHWSDTASVGLLGALAAGRQAARLLILASYRPFDAIANQHPILSLKRELAARKQCTEITLDGLTSEEVGKVLDRRFGPHRLPPALAPRLQAQTSGNPLFLVNALADLVQRGLLYEQDGHWQCAVDVDRLASITADGTRELIAMRLDLLPPATRALLEAASIAGTSFSTQAVAAAIEREPEDVETECHRLAHTLFLQEGEENEWPDGSRGRQLKFRHVLYRQELAEHIPAARRQVLHRRIAERLENGYGRLATEIAASLRYHYEQAGELFRAVDFIEIMAQQAFDRRAMHEAMALHQDAALLLARMPTGEDQQRRLRRMKIMLGGLATITAGVGDAGTARAIAEVESLRQAPSMSAEHLASLITVAMGHIAAGKHGEGCRVSHEILEVGGADPPAEVLLTGHSLAGIALFFLGEYPTALSSFAYTARLQGSVAPIRIGDGPLVSTFDTVAPALSILAQALTVTGRAEQGADAIEMALARARTIDLPWYVGYALSNACSNAVLRRDLGELRRRASQLLEHCGDGQPYLQSISRFMLGWAVVMEDRNPSSLIPLRQALDDVLGIPNPLVTTRYFSMLAAAHLQCDNAMDAAVALDRASAERGESGFYDAELQRQRALILLAGSTDARAQQAEAQFEGAVEVAARQGAHLFRLRATVDLCRLRMANGTRDEARNQLAQLLPVFAGSPNEVDVREAREFAQGL